MLTIRRLSKTYANGVKALDDVNLDIPPGLFGLLGPNGAGKSTLMRTIAGLQNADSGDIHFDGVDVARYPQALRRRLGYVPQSFGVYPGFSAPRLLDHFAVLKGLADRHRRRQQIAAILAETGLADAAKRAVSTYSGGMLRRFGIAVALLGDPALIITDEPTAGLDPEERNRFHQLLARLAANRVVVLSTHIVEDVRDLCPRAVILAGGKIVRQGSPDQWVAELHGKVWRKAVAPADEAAYRQKHTVLSTRLHGGRLMLHVVADQAPETGFTAVEPDLEDVYFHLLDRHQRGG